MYYYLVSQHKTYIRGNSTENCHQNCFTLTPETLDTEIGIVLVLITAHNKWIIHIETDTYTVEMEMAKQLQEDTYSDMKWILLLE